MSAARELSDDALREQAAQFLDYIAKRGALDLEAWATTKDLAAGDVARLREILSDRPQARRQGAA